MFTSPRFAACLVLSTCLLTAGCPDGGDDDDGPAGGTLHTGMYEVSEWNEKSDACEIYDEGFTLDQEEITVVVEDDTITFFDLEGSISAKTVEMALDEPEDLNDFGYDCVLGISNAIDGTIPGDNALDANYLFTLTVEDGEECEEAVADLYGLEIDIPCESEVSFHLERTGDIVEPPPPEPEFCRILWSSTSLTAGLEHIYFADLLIEDWTTGTQQYGLNNDDNWGIFMYGYDPDSGDYVAAGIAEQGSFLMDVDGTEPGDAVAFTDTSMQAYLDYDDFETVIGTDGRGTFTGVLTDLDVEDPIPGTGTVTIVYAGSNLTIGTKESYAYCY